MPADPQSSLFDREPPGGQALAANIAVTRELVARLEATRPQPLYRRSAIDRDLAIARRSLAWCLTVQAEVSRIASPEEWDAYVARTWPPMTPARPETLKPSSKPAESPHPALPGTL